jgi:hypothetical protein
VESDISIWANLTMAGPLAFPHAPPWIWQASFALSALAVLAGLSLLTYDFFVRPRGKRMDPFIAVAIFANVVAAISLTAFAIRVPRNNDNSSSGSIVAQPMLSLLPPKGRYTFKWDPTTGMYFDIQREGVPLPAGHTANPTFILHNVSSVARRTSL